MAVVLGQRRSSCRGAVAEEQRSGVPICPWMDGSRAMQEQRSGVPIKNGIFLVY